MAETGSHDSHRFRPLGRPGAHDAAWQLLDHHLRLPDEQGGFRAHGRDPRGHGLPPGRRRAHGRSGALQHLHHPRQRRAEGLQLPGPPGPAEAGRPGPHPGGGGMRGPAGGGIAAAPGAGTGSGDGPPAREPARGAAHPGGERPAGGGHRGAPHPRGHHRGPAGQQRLRLGERDLRLQRALHLLRGAVGARSRAVAPPRGHPPGDGGAGRPGLPGDHPAGPEHRRLRPRPARHHPRGPACAHPHRPAPDGARRGGHRADPLRHQPSPLLHRPADRRLRRPAEGLRALPHPLPERGRRRAAGHGPGLHGGALPPDHRPHPGAASPMRPSAPT